MSKILGVFTPKASLSPVYQRLIERASGACDHAHCFRSDFPVGAAILAKNKAGAVHVFDGSNVENETFPATICAERNAATTASHAGFKQFVAVALLCRKFPGGSPCGLCRDVLKHFDCDTDVLNICDHEGNVRLFKAKDLLPAAEGETIPFATMDKPLKRLVNRVTALSLKSHVPYSKQHRGAILFVDNEDERRRSFTGINIDNASYGGSACAEQAAMFAARTAGYTRSPLLIVAGADPINGESLQVLREFGSWAKIAVVQSDKSVVLTTLEQLLPDSFGPDALS